MKKYFMWIPIVGLFMAVYYDGSELRNFNRMEFVGSAVWQALWINVLMIILVSLWI